MEKRSPHTRLHVLQAMVAAGKVIATKSAVTAAADLGIDREGMHAVIAGLTIKDFHKSMTTYNDHTVWQDVYLPIVDGVKLYVKVTVIDDVLIVSFKEK
ncbi:type II toxin-antitoxin system MqsR family toxin [Pectobacterium carotovorum subsp. carotovorum]|nr:type II toxin-antitoxin system MqsR family toxin [Pectobacterium carotovorum]MCL6336372.1 type II toxin-antitoxin system MqsR family toxin [Pectobacterium carotovorum subsp. carotovorum]